MAPSCFPRLAHRHSLPVLRILARQRRKWRGARAESGLRAPRSMFLLRQVAGPSRARTGAASQIASMPSRPRTQAQAWEIPMRKRLIFNCFSMNVVSHIYHGLWRHPDSTQMHFDKLETWKELTGLLEKGKFDALFLADVIGIDPAYKGSWDTYIKEGLQIPCNDSGALCAALVGVTENLGLTFTSS